MRCIYISIQCVLLQFTTNTFQGVLITDGSNSYAVFLYYCPSMEWSGNAVIGWQASSSRYRNHPLSGNSDASEVACLNPDSSYNTVIFQLNSVGKSLYTPHSLFYTPSVTCSLWDSPIPQDPVPRLHTLVASVALVSCPLRDAMEILTAQVEVMKWLAHVSSWHAHICYYLVHYSSY